MTGSVNVSHRLCFTQGAEPGHAAIARRCGVRAWARTGLAALGWCLGGPDSPEAADDKASNAWSVFTAGIVMMVLEGIFQAAVLWVRNDTALAEDRA